MPRIRILAAESRGPYSCLRTRGVAPPRRISLQYCSSSLLARVETRVVWPRIIGQALGQQQFEVFATEFADEGVVGVDDGIGEFAFALLQLQYFFLDGVLGDEAIGEDLPGLADAVGAVDRLGFDGGVPPGIEEENVLRGRQIQAEAAGFEADEKQLAVFVGLEAIRRDSWRSRVFPSRYS